MFGQKSSKKEEATEVTAKTGTDPAIVASGASVLLSLYHFFVKGNSEMGIFVGLWAPTILAFASYFTQTKMSDKLKHALR